ncbi:relaxase/mobilization nuclease domain-containing protein [Spirosoma sp. 209]|uniref:relaxase/mobilization nuclease domain-containing protein n=1 Tax=Spirosoma sp. 209 TaxID=1955701 RepID=UPI00098D73BE|nr:relaxase/mobilization nuclease domain-containing protein [Spirosoma sp. 209]
MVIRILTGREVAGAVRYNERKVEEGQAERIQIANYPDSNMAEKYGQFRLQLLEQMTRLNPAVAKPSVHLAIAFHPTESITNDQLRQIGSEVMTEVGYGRQPYLMYRHDDTRHPHIHIVSVSIDPDGCKISDKFIRNRLNQIRNGIEQRHGLIQAEGIVRHRTSINAKEEKHEQAISTVVERALENFTFGSVDSLRQYLQMQGVVMKAMAGRSKTGVTFQAVEKSGILTRPIAASKLSCKPTNKRLATMFASQAERQTKGCNDVAAIIEQRMSRYESITETEYKATLQQIGVQVSDRGGVYLYVQERAGLVVSEDELGSALSRQALLTRFSENTIRKSVQPKTEVGQPHLNQATGESFKPESPADSNLLSTPSKQPQDKPRLKQLLPESFVQPHQPAIATTVEKVIEPKTKEEKASRGEAQEKVLLVEKSKKDKKNRQKKGLRL